MDKKIQEAIMRISRDEKMTWGEYLGPAMGIEDKETAEKYFKAMVEHHVRVYKTSIEEAIEKEKANLGYYAGYYDPGTAARVYKLFECAHPIFGAAIPSPKEAFDAGIKAGRK